MEYLKALIIEALCIISSIVYHFFIPPKKSAQVLAIFEYTHINAVEKKILESFEKVRLEAVCSKIFGSFGLKHSFFIRLLNAVLV